MVNRDGGWWLVGLVVEGRDGRWSKMIRGEEGSGRETRRCAPSDFPSKKR